MFGDAVGDISDDAVLDDDIPTVAFGFPRRESVGERGKVGIRLCYAVIGMAVEGIRFWGD